MDKISVIVPVYKVEKYLEECIESIVGQTYTNLEIFLVDDGSPDNSGKICDEWAKKDNRIKVIHKENGGQSSARNKALEKMTGDYFVFIDSDDFVDKDYVKLLKDNIDQFNADLSIVSFTRYKDGDEKKGEKFVETVTLTMYDTIKEMITWKKEYGVVWGKMYKTSIYGRLRFIEGIIHEDEFYLTDALDCVEVACYNSSQLYFYRTAENSTMNKRYTSARISSVESQEYKDKYLVEKGYTELLDYSRRAILFNTICLYFDAKEAKYKQDAKLLRKKYLKWYKVDKSKFPKMDKVRFALFRFSPFLYSVLYEFNRRRKCKN